MWQRHGPQREEGVRSNEVVRKKKKKRRKKRKVQSGRRASLSEELQRHKQNTGLGNSMSSGGCGDEEVESVKMTSHFVISTLSPCCPTGQRSAYKIPVVGAANQQRQQQQQREASAPIKTQNSELKVELRLRRSTGRGE